MPDNFLHHTIHFLYNYCHSVIRFFYISTYSGSVSLHWRANNGLYYKLSLHSYSLSIGHSALSREQWIVLSHLFVLSVLLESISCIMLFKRPSRRPLHSGLLLTTLLEETVNHESSYSRFHVCFRSWIPEVERSPELVPLCHATTSSVWGIRGQHSSSPSAS